MPQITGLGHVGIYAEDLMKQRDFYTRVMGLKVADEDLGDAGNGVHERRPGGRAPRVRLNEGPGHLG